MSRRDDGFSLIEILIVITIIAALMGLVVALTRPATDKQNILITRQRIAEISSAVEQLRSPQVLATYPPADPSKLLGPKREKVGASLGVSNDTNIGVECLFVAIHLKTISVRLEEKEDWLANTDGDTMAAQVTRSTSNAFFEYVDAWGNPFAYFSVRDYKTEQRIQMADGQILVAKPWRSEKTGISFRQDSFQLFSAGKDGEFNTADDLGNW